MHPNSTSSITATTIPHNTYKIATGRTNSMEGNDDRGKKLASGVEVIATDSTDNLNN